MLSRFKSYCRCYLVSLILAKYFLRQCIERCYGYKAVYTRYIHVVIKRLTSINQIKYTDTSVIENYITANLYSKKSNIWSKIKK